MKKLALSLICLAMATFSAFAASTAKCMLLHNGSATFYDADKIANAITASVDGDTISLSAGSFPGFTISKKITVRGAGLETVITSAVTANIPGTPTLTSTLLEYVNLGENDLTLSSAMNGVTIRQCRFRNFYVNGNNDNIILERCYISSYLNQSSSIKGLTAINSKINSVAYASSSSNVYSFINCNIWRLYNGYDSYMRGTFINCIISSENNNISYSNCSFINCLHGYSWQMNANASEQGCYFEQSSNLISTSNLECAYSTNELENKGYLGNDGTAVGAYGGVAPFTLVPAIPRVTDSSLAVDLEKKVLNVTINVTTK